MRYRFIGGDRSGEVIELDDVGATRLRLPVPARVTAYVWDDPPPPTLSVTEWTVQRWRHWWHLLGDDCEYLTPPAWELYEAKIDVSHDLLANGGWLAATGVSDHMVRHMPGTVMMEPLVWCSPSDQPWMITMHATAPIVR